MTVEFLFATVDGKLFERNPEVLRAARDWRVIDQVSEPSDVSSGDSRVLVVQERGLARSRNRAIEALEADIGFFCDDDIALPSDASERVQRGFATHPGADIVLFPVHDPKSGARTYTRPPLWWPTMAGVLSACSVQIAFRKRALERVGVRFDERFGLGARHATSEEAVFLADALRAGLRIEWADEAVAIHPLESSGRAYSERGLARAKGAALARIFGAWHAAWLLAFALRNWPLYRGEMSASHFLGELRAGARAFVESDRCWGTEAEADGNTIRPAFDVFAALEISQIRYAAWKDLGEAAEFVGCEGDAELDLWVHPEDCSRFASCVREHGYSEYRNYADVCAGSVAHFIRFQAGRHLHLHAHASLLSGDHDAKSHCFDPFIPGAAGEGMRGPLLGGVRAVPRSVELELGAARAVAKRQLGGDLGGPELERLRGLGAETPCSFESLCELLVRSGAVGRTRRYGSLRCAFERARVRVTNALAGLLGLSNKRTVGAAPAIAILGVDGSGKSTLSERLHATLAKKTSAQLSYLGGNSTTYSATTWVAYGLWRVTQRVASWGARDAGGGLTLAAEALYEYAKCADRVRRIRRANSWRARGVIQVFERYPVPGLFDVAYVRREIDDGKVVPRGAAGRFALRVFERADRLLARVPPPDVAVVLATPIERIEDRRSLDDDERKDVERKLEMLVQFAPAAAPLRVISVDNDRSLDETLASLCDLMTELLCSSNS
jgi:hypothetical protein